MRNRRDLIRFAWRLKPHTGYQSGSRATSGVTPREAQICSDQTLVWRPFSIHCIRNRKKLVDVRRRCIDSNYPASGRVVINEPSLIDISVSEPVLAPGVLLLAPDRLATHRSLPDTANADN